MEEKSQLTMKDIARMLGVSVATVSRALSGNSSISLAQREKIQNFAREHNYYPNAIAATLRHSKEESSRIIGVIVPELVHYYFSSVLTGIEEEARKRGYLVCVSTSGESYDREVACCEQFYKNKVCGIIVSQAKDTMRYEHFVRLQQSGVPLVFYDRICAGINCSRVVVDDYQGSYNAVSYMIERGCRRVAFYGTHLNMEIGINRLNGYKDALYHNWLPVDEWLMRECDNRETAEALTPELMSDETRRPDGFFAVNDDTAIGILYSCKRMGFDVPRDVQICGFTNGQRALACDPMLTSVEQRGVEVGHQAASVLIDTVEGHYPPDHVEKRIVRTHLVARGTTR